MEIRGVLKGLGANKGVLRGDEREKQGLWDVPKANGEVLRGPERKERGFNGAKEQTGVLMLPKSPQGPKGKQSNHMGTRRKQASDGRRWQMKNLSEDQRQMDGS